MQESSDREKLTEEVARIDSQIAALAELKRQYLVKFSAAAPVGLTENRTAQPPLSPESTISLFRSYFRGREDVYARRWENRAGRSGYSPACKHEWDRAFCRKPEMKWVWLLFGDIKSVAFFHNRGSAIYFWASSYG